jgi:hypothetical protein
MVLSLAHTKHCAACAHLVPLLVSECCCSSVAALYQIILQTRQHSYVSYATAAAHLVPVLVDAVAQDAAAQELRLL